MHKEQRFLTGTERRGLMAIRVGQRLHRQPMHLTTCRNTCVACTRCTGRGGLCALFLYLCRFFSVRIYNGHIRTDVSPSTPPD